MTSPSEPGYTYCAGGRVFLACERCGAVICNSDACIQAHDTFHRRLS